MFGGCFAINDAYQKIRGSNLKISMQFSFMGSLASVVVLLIINGFKFEFTPFTLIMSILATINGFIFTYCSFKALGSINLSLYSIFSMLGGMVLPFIQGILFYNEKITVAFLAKTSQAGWKFGRLLLHLLDYLPFLLFLFNFKLFIIIFFKQNTHYLSSANNGCFFCFKKIVKNRINYTLHLFYLPEYDKARCQLLLLPPQ